MKNNKKLVVLAGVAALGLVAATGVTSGFAWFAVNNTVSATSLNVQAKSNASYLLIGTADNASDKDDSSTSIAAVDPANYAVYPAAYSGASTVTWNHNTPDNDSDDVTIPASTWYTATVDSRTNGQADGNTVKYTNLETITNGLANTSYFVPYHFWLTLATGSEAVSKNITMTGDFTSDHGSVKAAVIFDGAAGSLAILDSTTTTSTVFSSVALAANTSHTVDIYMFIDGTNSDVKSETDISTLVGDVNFSFAI